MNEYVPEWGFEYPYFWKVLIVIMIVLWFLLYIFDRGEFKDE